MYGTGWPQLLQLYFVTVDVIINRLNDDSIEFLQNSIPNNGVENYKTNTRRSRGSVLSVTVGGVDSVKAQVRASIKTERELWK